MTAATPTSTTSMMTCKMPKMDAGSLRTYFHRCEDYFKTMKIADDEDKISIFKSGLSTTDYDRMVLQTTLPAVFADLKVKLIALYDPEESPTVSKDKFVTARQFPGEPLRLFAERLLTTYRKAYVGLPTSAMEELVRDQLKRGLRHARLREKSRLSKAKTMSDLVEELAAHEEVLDEEPEKVFHIAQVDKLSAQLEALEKRLNTLTEMVANRDTCQPVFAGECFNCARRGHLAANCTAARVKCERCRGNHLERFCRWNGRASAGLRRSRGEAENDPVAVSVHSSSVELTERDCFQTNAFTGVFATLNNQARPVMVDTGSAVSLLSAESWQELGKPPLFRDTTSLRSANGLAITTIGKCVLTVGFKKERVEFPFLVSPELSTNCLIGSDFLSKFGCRVDFREKEFKLRGESLPMFVRQNPHFSLVVSKDDVELPPLSESIVIGRRVSTNRQAQAYLISNEPDLSLMGPTKFLVAASIVSGAQQEVPVRVVNIFERPLRRRPRGQSRSGNCVGHHRRERARTW